MAANKPRSSNGICCVQSQACDVTCSAHTPAWGVLCAAQSCADTQCRCREFLSEPQAAGDFTIEYASGDAPAAENTCDVHLPVHLRHEFPYGTQSIGHLIRDNLQVRKLRSSPCVAWKCLLHTRLKQCCFAQCTWMHAQAVLQQPPRLRSCLQADS